MSTEKQLEANRRNARRSTGPKTSEGKERSRQNAVKHGMTAEALIVLPEEDAAELAERVDGWLRDLGGRNEVEEALIRHAATLSWKLDRGDRHEAAILTRKIQERAEVELAEFRARVITMANKLLPSSKEFQETGVDRAPAAELVRTVESTAEGCRRLLTCWGLVRQAAERTGDWGSWIEMAMVRLLGCGPGTVADPEILDMIIAGRVVKWAGDPLNPDHWQEGPYRLCPDPEALREACRRRPVTTAEARRRLLAVIDKAVARLEVIREIREREGDDWDAGESARVASFDASVEGERLRRYQTTTHRQMLRSIDSVSKLRSAEVRLAKQGLAANQEAPALAVVEPESKPNPDPAVLRNEPNPAAPSRPSESSGPDHGIILRNEPNFDDYGVEWIEVDILGSARDSAPPLRAAS